MGFFDSFLDFNGDGKVDPGEQAMGFMMFEDWQKEQEKSKKQNSDDDDDDE